MCYDVYPHIGTPLRDNRQHEGPIRTCLAVALTSTSGYYNNAEITRCGSVINK